MGIERLYADGIEQAYQRGLRTPTPAPDLDFRTGSFLAAGFGGLATGLLEQGASFLEGVAAFDRYSTARRTEMGARVADPERKAEVQRGLEAAGRAARMRAQESAPDPQTTHMADQVFHGLTRFGVKAVGSVVAAGPVGGAALLGAEETNTIYRDLTARGIDSETALKVAAVQGAISAAGVVLPVSGAGLATTTAGKVGATAALVGVGGPGAYVAQETLARDILQRAGYADEAAKHDPADLLGLGISTVLPGAFGAVALRGALRSTKPMPAVRTEAGVRDAVQLTPEEQAASDAYERSAANLAELRKEIARQKDPAARQVLEAELAKQTEAAAKAGQGAVAEMAARSPDLVDAARVKVLQETVQRSLPESPDAYPRLMEALDALAAGERVGVPDLVRPVPSLADFVAAGKYKAAPVVRDADGPDTFAAWLRSQGGIDIDEKFDISGDANNVRNNPGGVFRRGGLPTDELASRAAEAGFMLPYQAGDTRAFVDLVQTMIRGERVLSLEQQAAAAQRALERQGMDARVADLEARLQRLGEDPAAARGNPEAMEAYLAANERRLLAARVDEVARPADDPPEMDALRDQARQIAQDMQDGERTLAQYEADVRPLSPVMRRLVQEELDAPTTPQAANPEAAAPARGAGDEPAATAADAGRPAADVQASGVARTVADQERRFMESLAADRPDMMVTLPGTNEAIRLGDAVEMIRAQQALDESDADLVRAAVLCDLSP